MTESRFHQLVKAAEKLGTTPIRTALDDGQIQVTVHTPDGPVSAQAPDVNDAAGRVLELL